MDNCHVLVLADTDLHLRVVGIYASRLQVEQAAAAETGVMGGLCHFRVGAEDAQYLAREFYPVFSEDDLLNLPAHHICLRMTIDGVASRPFSARTVRQDLAYDSSPPIQRLLATNSGPGPRVARWCKGVVQDPDED
jgi:hypothetical protein